MNYKHVTIGLVSVSMLLSACTSIRNSPGYRSNVSEDGFQRSGSTKELDGRMIGLSRPSLPTPAPMYQNAPANPAQYRNIMPVANRAAPAAAASPDMELVLGQRNFYREDAQVPSIERGVVGDGPGIALNFERASIREVVKVVLGDILKLTYTVEPGVEGEVTISSSDPIPRDSLLPTLESLLQTQGAVLYADGSGYRVASRANMKGRGIKPSMGKLKTGYGLQVIPLRYIPATEMQKILEPLANPDAFVRVDANRNLLILAGTSAELANLMATINTFDVDALQGMSVGIFRIKNVEAPVVAKSLESLFGESGSSPMAGMVKILPLEHMNSIMIVSASPDYLKEMKTWIDRFDQTSPTAGQQLYVYRVQNGSAENLAEMLTQIFSGKGGSSSKKNATSSLAPGLQPATVSAAVQTGMGDATQPQTQIQANISAGGSGGGLNVNTDQEVRIVADKTNNSLMILATESMYQQITEALKRIDVMPMQVQVEASIMEITLSDNLEYGLQWYFKNSVLGQTGRGGFDTDGTPGLSASVPGFSYSLADPSGTIRAVLSTLAKQSKLRVISSPSVLVLDNQTAEIRVGSQQPVSMGANASNGVVTENIQFKDTGVSLKVTPHVNGNGLVKMDIEQDMTDVGEIDAATKQRSFLQRNIKSNVAIQSGQTIVLGGLIRENASDARTGVPVLSDMPIVGNLFNGKSRSGTRTELLVLITPTAIKDQKGLVKTGEEMRERMRRLFEGNRFVNQLEGRASSAPSALVPLPDQEQYGQ